MDEINHNPYAMPDQEGGDESNNNDLLSSSPKRNNPVRGIVYIQYISL